jgi:tRNA pseudouridine55 synthase
MGACGVLVVNKPRGPTSFDIVAQTRRLFHTKQVGHAGTLDPLASGVLVVLVGEATKLSAHLTLATKSYIARIEFGTSTDTLDAEGSIVEATMLAPGWLSDTALLASLDQERGRTQQVPPEYSAIKIHGRTAYSLARKGVAVELPERPVEVHDLRVLERGDTHVCVELQVSKGYYVRSLARDLSLCLGVPGHLAALQRTMSGCFSLTEAVGWPAAEPPPLLSLGSAVRRALPYAHLTELGVVLARQGKRLGNEAFEAPPPDPSPVAWLDASDHLVALGGPAEEAGTFRVLRGFNDGFEALPREP